MSPRDIAASWVGHDVRDLKSQWDLIWWDATDSAKNEYTLYAQFGENAHTRDDSYTQHYPGGPNVIIAETVEQYTQVPKTVVCTAYFYASAQTFIITRYEIVGNCAGYTGEWKPAPRIINVDDDGKPIQEPD